MVQHIVLLKVKPDISPEKLDELIVETRIRLLKINDLNNLRVGKRIDQANPHTLFYAFEVENMDKLTYVHDNAIYVQFEKQILTPFTTEAKRVNYEMEPGKDVRYS